MRARETGRKCGRDRESLGASIDPRGSALDSQIDGHCDWGEPEKARFCWGISAGWVLQALRCVAFAWDGGQRSLVRHGCRRGWEALNALLAGAGLVLVAPSIANWGLRLGLSPATLSPAPRCGWRGSGRGRGRVNGDAIIIIRIAFARQ